eukprot:scaffold593384_cov18-Prasinocladus_malaysianus.AAC.1
MQQDGRIVVSSIIADHSIDLSIVHLSEGIDLTHTMRKVLPKGLAGIPDASYKPTLTNKQQVGKFFTMNRHIKDSTAIRG